MVSEVQSSDSPSTIEELRHQQGFDTLNKSKQEELEEKFREQKKMKDLHIDDYNPWGKPGAGAPNLDSVRKRRIFMDVLPPVILQPTGNDLTVFGRPGGGAPLRSKSGKVKHSRVEDPQIRFQFQGPSRKIVDFDLRYKIPYVEQNAYKQELDNFVKEKQCIEAETKTKEERKDRELGSESSTFRRLGSHPQDNKQFCERFPYLEDAVRVDELTGGIELEPLLSIRHRRAKRYPLTTSDVTGAYEIRPHITIAEDDYNKVLEHQLDERERHKQEELEESKETSRKHFEHWDQFWGRPGHGAPRQVKVKENLEYILYHLPILIQKHLADDESTSPHPVEHCKQ